MISKTLTQIMLGVTKPRKKKFKFPNTLKLPSKFHKSLIWFVLILGLLITGYTSFDSTSYENTNALILSVLSTFGMLLFLGITQDTIGKQVVLFYIVRDEKDGTKKVFAVRALLFLLYYELHEIKYCGRDAYRVCKDDKGIYFNHFSEKEYITPEMIIKSHKKKCAEELIPFFIRKEIDLTIYKFHK